MTKSIVFTGGGTAGHVTPNIALIEALQQEYWTISYMGCAKGVEKSIITPLNIPFIAVSSGKLRRYFSWQNFLDPFKIIAGIVQSFFQLRRIKPTVVFSKGGFVAFPVVVGAWLNRIPVIAHESDMTPGLANQLSYPFAQIICVTFAAAKTHFKQQEKIVVTGTPIRRALFQGNKQRGLTQCGFNDTKPCLLVIGGSQGASIINTCIHESLPQLLEQFQIIHLCGKDKINPSLANQPGYHQIEYANEELPHLLAASDLIISRSGANSLCEILALNKPHVLIPLSRKHSRGDQIHNAAFFKQQGVSTVVEEEQLTPQTLLIAVQSVYAQRETLTQQIEALHIGSATDKILHLLRGVSSI